MYVFRIESARKREQARASESKREMERRLDGDIGSVCAGVSLQLLQNTHTNSSCMRLHCITLLDGQRTDTTPQNTHTIICPLAYTHLKCQPLTRKHRWRQCEALGVCIAAAMSRRQHRQNEQSERTRRQCVLSWQTLLTGEQLSPFVDHLDRSVLGGALLSWQNTSEMHVTFSVKHCCVIRLHRFGVTFCLTKVSALDTAS